MTTSTGTLGALIDGGYTLYVFCASDNCNESNKVDLEALAGRYGRDHGAMHWDLVKLPWRCQRCGSRSVSFRLQPGGIQYASPPGRRK
jgi:hypothetical protein